MHLTCPPPLRGFLWRVVTFVPLVSTTAFTTPAAMPVQAAAPSCRFLSPTGAPSAITRVIHVEFDNVHFRRDNPNVSSDLEQMPHLLNFIESNGVLLSNDHTPLIAHTATDFVTGLTGVYGDQHGLSSNNSFEYYNGSALGSFNTSAFTYWTDKVSPPSNDSVDAGRKFPVQMIDSAGNNLQAPWVPYVKAGCNVGAVSTANMVLERAPSDVIQVFGAGSTEAAETTAAQNNDFIGIAVHCADNSCSTVGNGSGAGAKAELGGQGFGALYGHAKVIRQIDPNSITQTDGTPITGFAQANGFSPTSSYTLGYMLALLKANVPVVYGEVASAHDPHGPNGRDSCPLTSAGKNVAPDAVCGSFAPGEADYVGQLKQWDLGFEQFFTKLDAMGVNASNTLFVFHSDENDHYTGSAPTNSPCDGVQKACTYDRTRLGEITTDLPMLLKQQGLYDFGMLGGSTTTTGTPRPGFTNTDLAYGVDFDTAPGFWLKGHPANGSTDVRKLEGALSKVTSPNPYTGQSNEVLFRFLVDLPGMKALHMVSSDPNRTPAIYGFGSEDHFISTSSITFAGGTLSACNKFPAPTDATCLNSGFIWLHGNFAEDVNHTWAALVGPGVATNGVDAGTWADHTDIRPTMLTLLCLKDGYTHEGRALLEDLQQSALPESAQDMRGALTSLGKTFKQLNAPVGRFGKDAISVSTAAIRGDSSNYSSLESSLSDLVTRRDALAGQIEAQLDQIPGCGTVSANADKLGQLKEQAQQIIDQMHDLAGSNGEDQSGDSHE